MLNASNDREAINQIRRHIKVAYRYLISLSTIDKTTVVLVAKDKIYFISKNEEVSIKNEVDLPVNFWRGMRAGYPSHIPELNQKIKEEIGSDQTIIVCPSKSEFINTQVQRKIGRFNPYTEDQGYYYSLIHEFAHCHFQLNYFPNSLENFESIVFQSKKNLGRKERIINQNIPVEIPNFFLGEIYAIATELEVAKLDGANHYENLIRYFKEGLKNVEHIDSDQKKYNFYNVHFLAALLAPTIIRKEDWWNWLLGQDKTKIAA